MTLPNALSAMKSLMYLAGGLVLSVMLAACGSESASQPVLEPVVRPVKIHTVASPGSQTVREYPGAVEAAEQATLSFEMPGEVTGLDVREGESVQKGQTIARLQARDVQAQVDAARATRDAAEAAYERAQRLYEQDIVSLQQLESQRRAYEVAASELASAREALRNAAIVAPFDGEVAKTYVEANERVQPLQPVVKVQNVTRMEVVVDVPEQDQLDRRLKSAPLRVSLSALPDRTFPASLQEVATSADPETRTYEATVTFSPPAGIDVLPGMTARLLVGAPDASAAAPSDRDPLPETASSGGTPSGAEDADAGNASLTIPASAVFSAPDGTPSVWVVDGSRMTVARQPVSLGPLQNDRVEVASGLAPGTKIAATGVHRLTDGQEVRPYTN